MSEQETKDALPELAALEQQLAEQAGKAAPQSAEDRERARARFSERLEIAGALAKRVAHDFNNMLTPLLAYPALIRKDIPEGAMGRELLDILEQKAHDLGQVTQHLMWLTKRQLSGDTELALNDVVGQALSLLQGGVLPDGIRVRSALGADVGRFRGVSEQILRVVQGLISNAVDAMGEQGVLSVKTENVTLDAPAGQADPVPPGRYVKVTVADTGCGIADDARGNVFDPFYSTKNPAKRRSAGLGLSVAYGVTKSHGGYIDVRSIAGKGTVASIFLPAAAVPASARAAEAAPAARREKILIVDDDPTQIQVNTKVLGSLGYEVHGVQSGEEAVEYLKSHKADLVMLDIAMPAGISGLETFRRIKESNPDQKAIIMSGLDPDEEVAQMQSMGAGEFIKKIVSIEKLSKSVRAELDKAAKRGFNRKKLRILVVDDEEMIRSLFRMLLSSCLPDATIDTACNGAEAVESFTALHHAMLVMDLNMPVMDGKEAFARIEQVCKEKGWEMPSVIFCTGFAPPGSVEKTVKASPKHALLPKPVTEETLVQAIKARL